MFEDEDYNSDELIVSTKTEYDAEENALRPKTMADYVGQEKVKENLGARRSTTSFCTALPGWAKPRWRISSPTKWVCRSS